MCGCSAAHTVLGMKEPPEDVEHTAVELTEFKRRAHADRRRQPTKPGDKIGDGSSTVLTRPHHHRQRRTGRTPRLNTQAPATAEGGTREKIGPARPEQTSTSGT